MGDKYYAGETPTLALLKRGSVVFLVSNATGKTLRINPNETVDGNGGEGVRAQFIVHIRGPGVVAFQSFHSPDKWIHVRDDKLDGRGEGGRFTEFKVEDHDGFATFESVNYRGHHIGIVNDGSPKAPSNTGVGGHARFSVKVKDAVDEWILPSRSPVKRPFAHGNIIVLESKSSGKTLRLRGDNNNIEGLGGEGDWARWIVHVYGRKIVALQNFNQRDNWLRINEGGHLNGDGAGGLLCRFKVKKVDGYVVLESVSFPGQHVGILPDGSPKLGHQTGTGEHARFRPKVMVKQPEYNQVGKSPLTSILTHGNEIVLYSRASKKTLRIRDDGTVDGDGGEGEWARFIIYIRAPGVVALQSAHDKSRWLRIGDKLESNGKGAKNTFLKVHEISGHLVFESVERPGSHVGVLPNGSAKDPQSTGHGEHAQFWPKVKSASPYITYIAGTDEARSEILDGKKVILQSKAGGKSLRIVDGNTVDAHGGRGEWAQFKADIRGPGIVSFENNHFKDKWLAINHDQVLVGGGGFYTQFKVKAIGRYVALESHVYDDHHVGVKEDSSLKPPSKTGTGNHGQFLPDAV